MYKVTVKNLSNFISEIPKNRRRAGAAWERWQLKYPSCRVGQWLNDCQFHINNKRQGLSFKKYMAERKAFIFS
jgi:hypothetical protein